MTAIDPATARLLIESTPGEYVEIDDYGWNDAWQRLGGSFRGVAQAFGSLNDVLIGVDFARRRPSRGYARHVRRMKARQ